MEGHGDHNARVWVVAVFVLGLYGGLLGRLYLIQAKEQSRFQAMARSQHFVRLLRNERRGSIVDCRQRPLATSVQVPSIFVNPCEVEDTAATARRLAGLLGLDSTALLARLERPVDLVCLKHDLGPDQEQRLRCHPAVRALADALEFRDGALYARPERVTDPEAAAAALAPLLASERDELEADLQGLRRFVWIKRRVTDDEAKRVLAARDLGGVGVVHEYKRVYPHGQLACQLVGFAGLDEQGLEGLEQTLDDTLTGRPGHVQLQRDAAGRYISIARSGAARPPQAGADVQLSVDSVIQGYAEAALREAWDLWAPKAAFAVVLDPQTGDTLAAASLPAYDLNAYADYDPSDLKDGARARYIVDWMEPGSVMKAFVFSAALAEGLITEQKIFNCENGVWLIGRRRFHDHHAYGNLTAAEVIIKSSNIGAAKIGTLLGPERLYRYLRAFGFAQPTGFDLPGENPGKLRPTSQWTSFSLPSISVGQEICVSQLQMALAYAAIANDGVLMRPRVIQGVRRPDGTWTVRPAKQVRRVIPATIAQRVRRVLCATVERGTGKAARMASYTAGGKTGTAQKPVPGGLSHTAVICSFVAMAPIERPRLVCMVTVDEPTKTAGGRHFGGTVAAPVVGQILKQSLAYLGLPPDKPQALVRLGLAEDSQRR